MTLATTNAQLRPKETQGCRLVSGGTAHRKRFSQNDTIAVGHGDCADKHRTQRRPPAQRTGPTGRMTTVGIDADVTTQARHALNAAGTNMST